MSLSQCTKNFDHIMFGCRVMALTKRQVILHHNFCPFTPLVSLTIKILQNKCLEKLWCYTSVPKLGSHDFWLNRCGFGQMDGRTEKGMEGRIKEVTYRGGYLKTNKKKKEHQILRMSSWCTIIKFIAGFYWLKSTELL